jgi:ribonucleoside-diphosphate reductase alpha chain
VINDVEGGTHKFFIEFGEYEDGRLGEVFITAHKHGTFVRGTLDALARMISIALQSGTAPHEVAKTLMGLSYPPYGEVVAEGSTVVGCTSVADYLAREIAACYSEDGRRRGLEPVQAKIAGYKSEDSGV